MLSLLRSALILAIVALAFEMAGPGSSVARASEGADRLPAAPAADAAARAPAAGVCRLIEVSARSHGLPPEFLARLLWKESRFNPRAVSPKGALGIAQFMPGTARLRALRDPLDIRQAIPASAAYLAKLRRQFGNFGLAAAAYNSGENRVTRWLAGRAGLPRETLDYVFAITGRPADWFRTRGREVERRALHRKLRFDQACRALPQNSRTALFRMPPAMPWSVQVAGHQRKSTAVAQFARIESRPRRLIDAAGPAQLRVRSTAGASQFWSVEVAMKSRSGAIGLCARLRAEGTTCLVWGG